MARVVPVRLQPVADNGTFEEWLSYLNYRSIGTSQTFDSDLISPKRKGWYRATSGSVPAGAVCHRCSELALWSLDAYVPGTFGVKPAHPDWGNRPKGRGMRRYP